MFFGFEVKSELWLLVEIGINVMGVQKVFRKEGMRCNDSLTLECILD